MKVSPLAVISGAGFAMPALLALALAGCVPAQDAGNEGNAAEAGAVTEYAIPYPAAASADAPAVGASSHEGMAGSTHEIAFDPGSGTLWISGQNHDYLVRIRFDAGGRPAMGFVPTGPGSGPHGIAFDAAGNRWVTLEYRGRVQAFDQSGAMIADHDVSLCADPAGRPRGPGAAACATPVNSHPHGLGVGGDGRTIWFTGKATGTIGRIGPDGALATFVLPTPGSVPIYIRAGPDGNMWVTELAGNKIARVTPAGVVTEFAIPTPYARPIAIVPGPDGNMWFSEEAGSRVARITPAGVITEFTVPRTQPNQILAGLAFDREGNLWVQQYVDHNVPSPGGADNIVRIDRAGLAGGADGLAAGHFTVYPVPSRDTVMHRIIEGPDGAMWFTEMRVDRLGRVAAGARR